MKTTEAYLVGVDGGGSKTIALIAGLNGSILGRGQSGSSNYHAIGIESAGAALEQALATAFADAGTAFEPQRVQMACFGLAGLYRSEDEQALQALVMHKWPGMPALFTHDARSVLAAGTPNDWGIAIICGTGSMVYGRNPQGQSTLAGGWGYLLGDEGSGYEIGCNALRSVARAADGRGPQTALTGLILAHWNLPTPQGLIGYVYRPVVTKTQIAGLATIVEQAALAGDEVATGLLQAAAGELARAAKVVAGRLGFTGPAPCALAGGVLVKGTIVRQNLRAAAAAEGLELAPVQQVTEPAVGAIRLAKENAQIHP